MYTNNINKQIHYIIDTYAEVGMDGDYYVDINKIPELEIDEICSLIMASDKNYAVEACCPDNDSFFKDMLPSMITMLSKRKKEFDEEFVSNWKKGIRSYYLKHIKELIESSLETQNTYHNLTNNTYSELYL